MVESQGLAALGGDGGGGSDQELVDEARAGLREARGLGTNAIISLHFSTSMINGRLRQLLAYGTAVVLEDEPDASA